MAGSRRKYETEEWPRHGHVRLRTVTERFLAREISDSINRPPISSVFYFYTRFRWTARLVQKFQTFRTLSLSLA